MNTYVIRRRSNWKDAQELHAAAARSTQVGNEEMPTQVRWIRSYVVQEADGRLGTVCIYQATDEDAIREHARRADLQADEITQVVDTVVVREDPSKEPAAA
jgi:thiamine biosynthesis protein ThiC